jgi:hypothetical protein
MPSSIIGHRENLRAARAIADRKDVLLIIARQDYRHLFAKVDKTPDEWLKLVSLSDQIPVLRIARDHAMSTLARLAH